ncbi:hypothetical protein EDD22DRAFT_952200 [Suillus occidentalis]|nr:hypothetical protein EDD22DRAFT_952200 [Suillus occidentalis]
MSIKTDQISGVQVLAYSPSGERIASGGYNTICIWNAKTAKLVVGPIKTPGAYVTSLVRSSDSTKFYFASDGFARVFDGKSGKLLHRFEHNRVLWSVALSPKHNVLACQLGQLFHQNHGDLYYVLFSQDGRYVAYGGSDKKITLWVVRDVAPWLLAPTILQKSNRQSAQQETRSNSPSSSCLDGDATGGGGFIEEVYNNLYSGNFFQSSRQSLPLSSPGFRFPSLFSDYRLLSIFSRRCPPADESVPKVRSKCGFFSRHTRSNSSLELATIKFDQPVPEGKVGEGEGENIDNHGSGNDLSNNRKDKGKQRDDDPSTDIQSLPSDDPTPPTKLDSADNGNIWTWLMRSRGNNPTLVGTASIIEHPKVVKVFPARRFQRLIVMKRECKIKLPEATYSIPLAASNTGASSSAGQLSQALDVPLVSAHVSGSSQPQSSNMVSVQARPSSHLVFVNGAQYSQVTGGPSTYASPSHFVTNYHTSHDIDSRSSIEGTCNRFLNRICFPCGHYYEDS